MKKVALILASVAVLAVGSVAVVMAQTPTPPASSGQSAWGCGGSGGGSGSYDPPNDPTLKRLADKIGIAATDLAGQLKGGKSIVDVGQAKGVEEQSLVDVLVAPQVDMLQLRVKYGYITKDQADAIQKSLVDRARNRLEQKGLSGGFGMMDGGHGGMMGGGYGGMMGQGSY